MKALEMIWKSRKDSCEKLAKQIADIDNALAACSLTVKPVYESEKAVKVARYERLKREADALEAEIRRLNPELPGVKVAKK